MDFNHRQFAKKTAIAAIVVAALPSAAWADALSTLRNQVKNAGFQPVYPIITGLTPGLLYMERKDATGQVVRTVLCEDLFVNHQPIVSDAVLANISADNTSDTKASLSLLPGLFKSEANASAQLAAAGVEKGTLAFGGTKISGLQAGVSKDGVRREISPICMNGIAPFFRPNGKTDRKIFLIARTLSVGELSYDMQVKKDRGAGLEAALKNIIGLSFGYKKTTDTTAKISFGATPSQNRMIVGLNAIRISNLKRDTQVSDQVIASVSGEEVKLNNEFISFVLPRTQ